MDGTYCILRETGEYPSAGPFARPRTPGPTVLGEAGVTLAAPAVDVARLSKSELGEVARDPDVRAFAPVMPTRLIFPVAGQAVDRSPGPSTWGVRAVGADVSPRTGAGVTVAVLDTGIDAAHPAFVGVDLVQRNFAGTGDGDHQGHGTHCAGTIFGRDVDGTRIGVAPGVSTAMAGKVLRDDGAGDSTMLFHGLQWAVQEGAHVVSLSVGFDFPGMVARHVADGWPADLATSAALEAYRANLRMFDALMELVRSQAAFGHGTVVVAAAGNESRRTVDPTYEIGVSLPAAADGVVSVGALEQSPEGLTVAPFSNTFPHIAAPGVDVVSARAGGGLTSLSGTSMATPHVAGVAALWWEEVLASPLPPTAGTVTARLLAHARTDAIAAGVDVADRGVGLVRAPGA
ncbi:S8 family peptidase [Georgenia yuyongxinii]|uniref:S8 family serine peptidase n=1 Tax=Georgenia yuyongxinii TaxID=2589797 RepID=A0A552WYH9_9MICO|nr:S8 family serine peptidase [Georgenia yuyongxinii]TRW47393.1 S8 family serine peptidase [Georgenia yuyongxinii]